MLGLYRLALVLALLVLALALALAVALASILYSGMLATCLGVAPYAGIKFGSYEAIKGALGQVASVEEQDLVPWQRVTAGAIAGLIAQTGKPGGPRGGKAAPALRLERESGAGIEVKLEGAAKASRAAKGSRAPT